MSQHAIKLVPASVIPPPLSWKSSSVFPLFSFDFNFFFFFLSEVTETRCKQPFTRLISCQYFLCLVFSDITLRYKETRRRKQEVPGDRPLGNGNGNTVTPSGRSKLNGSLETVRQRKSWERLWVLTGLSSTRFEGKMERLKNIYEAKDTHEHGFVPTWMKCVIKKEKVFSSVALSCNYCRELTCSIHVEHDTFLGL